VHVTTTTHRKGCKETRGDAERTEQISLSTAFKITKIKDAKDRFFKKIDNEVS